MYLCVRRVGSRISTEASDLDKVESLCCHFLRIVSRKTDRRWRRSFFAAAMASQVLISIPQQEPSRNVHRPLCLARLLTTVTSLRLSSECSSLRNRRNSSKIARTRCDETERNPYAQARTDSELRIRYYTAVPQEEAEKGAKNPLQRTSSEKAQAKPSPDSNFNAHSHRCNSMPNLRSAQSQKKMQILLRCNSEEVLPQTTTRHRRKSTGSYFKELCLECKNGFSHCVCPEIQSIGNTVTRDIEYFKERLLRAPSTEDVCGADDESKPFTTDFANARHFMKNNPYITEGYRTFRSKERCIRGIFRWNNETLNIWTNFVALIGILALYACDLLFNYSSIGFNSFDKTLSGIMLLNYMVMLLFSSIYHIFNCCCYRCHRYWYFWDFVGIVASVYAYGVGFLFLQFRFHPFWIAFYATIMSIIALIPISMCFHKKFAHERYDESRSIWIGGFVMFSIVPIVHYVVLQGGLTSLVVKYTLPHHIIVISLLVASYIIYETKVPER